MSKPVVELSEEKAADFIAELLDKGAVHERIPAVASQLTGAEVINGESIRAAIQSAQIPAEQQATVEGIVMETYAKHAAHGHIPAPKTPDRGAFVRGR